MAIKSAAVGVTTNNYLSPYIELTPAMLSGAVAGSGTRVNSVGSAWAVSGNNVQATATVQVSTDGLGEGYCWAVEADVLIAALGTTADNLRNGVHSIVVAIRQKSDPGAGCNFGVALARSSDDTGAVATLTGGGGGFRAATGDSTTIVPMAFDSSQESVGSSFKDMEDVAAIARIEGFGGYWSAVSTLQVSGQNFTERAQMNASGFASASDDIWLVMWLGGATAETVSADADIWFALAAGSNYNTVPS